MVHWSKGPDADAIRDKIRQKAIGRTVSRESIEKAARTREERGSTVRGERHWNWKGGRPWRRFRDPRYQAWRNAVLQRDNYRCRDCGRVCKKYERGLAAHHLEPYADRRELRYDVSNGVTLCRTCHMARHGKRTEAKPLIPCACGCGTLIAPIDAYGRERRYVNHHAARGRPKPESMGRKLSEQLKGKGLTPEHRAKISEGLRTSSKRIGRPPKDTR